MSGTTYKTHSARDSRVVSQPVGEEKAETQQKKLTAIREPYTKAQLYAAICEDTGMSKKDVAAVFESLGDIAHRHFKKRSAGSFTLPGGFKLTVQTKKATKAEVKPEPIRVASLLSSLSGHWARLDETHRSSRTSLAILHGLAERLGARQGVDKEKMKFFKSMLLRIGRKDCEPAEIENEAAGMGLHVMDPEEIVTDVHASSGVIDSISDDGKARVILLDQDDVSVLDDITVPINWLPRAYREEGACVVWVERRYKSGVKGRFEPGSARG